MAGRKLPDCMFNASHKGLFNIQITEEKDRPKNIQNESLNIILKVFLYFAKKNNFFKQKKVLESLLIVARS